jgi:hypothetical protein
MLPSLIREILLYKWNEAKEYSWNSLVVVVVVVVVEVAEEVVVMFHKMSKAALIEDQ